MANIKETIIKSDYIISFGSFLATDDVEVQNSIIESIEKNNSEFVYMHPIDSIDLKIYYTQFIKYEVGSEEGVASLLLNAFVKVDGRLQEYIDDLDIGYISAESSAGEEEFEEALEKTKNKKQKTLVVGRDIFSHKRFENITKILNIINKYSELTVVSLDEKYQKLLDDVKDEALETIERLDSYNGTILYTIYSKDNTDTLVGSKSFAKIAKVANRDEIFINCQGEKVSKKFLIDKNLYGIIALCAMKNGDSSILSQGYRYKQVKIEKFNTK